MRKTWLKLTLKKKFLFPTVGLILIGMGASSTISFILTRNTLRNVLVEDIRKTAGLTSKILDGWLKDRGLDAQNWAKQKLYVQAVQDSFMGKAARASAGKELTALQKGYGYYKNICLADQKGVVSAYANPEGVDDLAVADQPYFKDLMGGKAFAFQLRRNPANKKPELILAARLESGNQAPGILLSIIEIERIDSLFIDSIKIGESGFAYLYESQGLVIAHPDREMELNHDMRSDPDFKQWSGMAEGTYTYEFEDVEQWVAFKKLPSMPWFVAVNIHANEVLAPARRLGKIVVAVAALVVLAAGLLIWGITNSVVGPINRVVAGLKDAAEGQSDLTKRLAVSTRDEVGELALWFNTFIEKVQVIISDVVGHAVRLKDSSSELRTISTDLSGGADQTTERAQAVAAASEEMSANMASVATTMEEASTNINMVAASTEEMSTTINDIAHSTESAHSVADSSVSFAEEASGQVNELGNAAQEIGKVVETITDISEQVNLLALNATIEAARAGEAGKGFAVVANEIKELAKQTAAATGEIKSQVSAIQSTTDITVHQINKITEVAREVNDIVGKIASAVEEQSSTTGEISGNVAQASQGIGEINVNVAQSNKVSADIAKEIAEVTKAAEQMSNSSSKVNLSAEQLATLAEELNGTVGRFKI